MRTLGRRRFLAIAAAGAGIGLAPWGFAASRREPALRLHRWRGALLGAEASILFAHPEAAKANRLLDACLTEIERLERVFSLHRADSAISRLNREGRLDGPPRDLVLLLAESRRYGEPTGGAFDPTVQPLWRLYADHFARPHADPAGPGDAAIDRALRLVDYRRVEIGTRRIAFPRKGMAVTLNGIAQGYITDRVADLLRDGGLERVLVNLGEYRAVGQHPEGRPWRIGLADPRDPTRVFRTLDIEDRAVATSGGYGTPFDVDGRHHHLFDPGTGRSSHRVRSVTVIAPRAATADALSTALAVMPPAGVRRALAAFAPVTAVFKMNDNSVVTRRATPSPRDLRMHAEDPPRGGRPSPHPGEAATGSPPGTGPWSW